MTKEEILEQLKHNRDLCNFNPFTGKSEPINEDCRKSVEALDMAIKMLKDNELWKKSYEEEHVRNIRLEEKIKALEQDNEKIFKKFKKKAFLESENVLGNEIVDSYMITDYLAELLGVEND